MTPRTRGSNKQMDKTGLRYTTGDSQFALFSLGGRDFGIEVGNVKEIVRLKKTIRPPDCPPFLEGFINLRNILVPVLDLRNRFSLPASDPPGARIIIIISISGLIAGLPCDSVGDVGAAGTEKTPALQQDGPSWRGCVEALVESIGRTVCIIDPSALLTGDERLSLSAPFTQR